MGASDAAAGSKIFVGGLDRTVDEGARGDDGGRARTARRPRYPLDETRSGRAMGRLTTTRDVR